MVEVEMGRHDVTYVAWAIAQIHNLPQRRLGDFEPRPHCEIEQMSESSWLVDVLDAEPGVDEDQPVIALDQEAVAAHRRRRQKAARALKAEEPQAEPAKFTTPPVSAPRRPQPVELRAPRR
jgi:hypothetical protein